MLVSQFDFDLPQSLIAMQPVEPRDSSRLLVVGDGLQDKHFRDLTDYLRPGDVLVMNDTRVIPARLFGMRGEVKVELLLHKTRGGTIWKAFARPSKRLARGDRIQIAPDFQATVIEKLPYGEVVVQFDTSVYEKLQRYGHMPLPPYIARADEPSDRERYQTVYAKHEGSVAAPTAGLHFTEDMLQKIDAQGVTRAQVTLHVGGGTFLPVKVEDTKHHIMHSEHAVVSKETARTINEAKAKGGRIIAVGTTSLRTLEAATDDNGKLKPFNGDTDIFITPGYQFKLVDALVTNFHLPRSTLFMLVSAFCGLERMQVAYQHAVAHQYRFYSYGDACLLLP